MTSPPTADPAKPVHSTSSIPLTQLPTEVCLLDIGSCLDGRDFFALVRCCKELWLTSRSSDYRGIIRDRYTTFLQSPERIIIDLPQYQTSCNQSGGSLKCHRSQGRTTVQYHHPAIGSLALEESQVNLYLQCRIKLLDLSGKEIIEVITQRNYTNACVIWRQDGFTHESDWEWGTSEDPRSSNREPHTVMVDGDPGNQKAISPTRYSGSIQHLFRMTKHHVVESRMEDNCTSPPNQSEPSNSEGLEDDHLSYQCSSYIVRDTPPYMSCTSPLGNFRITPEGTLRDKNPTTGRYLDQSITTWSLTRPQDSHDTILAQLRKRWGLPDNCNIYQEFLRRITLLTPEQYHQHLQCLGTTGAGGVQAPQSSIIPKIQPWYDRVPIIRQLLTEVWTPMDNPQASLAANWRASYNQEPPTRGHTWSYSLIGEENYMLLEQI